MTKRDANTQDLFDFKPDQKATLPSFKPETIKAARLTSKISKAVSVTLSEADDLERADIARLMTDYLGETVPASTLDGYSSEARTKNKISVERTIALCHATNDFRLISMMAAELGLAVIEERYLPAVTEAMALAEIEHLTEVAKQARKKWTGPKS